MESMIDKSRSNTITLIKINKNRLYRVFTIYIKLKSDCRELPMKTFQILYTYFILILYNYFSL